MAGLSSNPTGLSALVVDDERNMRLLAQATLRSIGFEVYTAPGAEEALEILETIKPDVVLMDVLMPGIDGFELCRRVRERAEFRVLPIIMITGLNDLESINRAYEVGATDFVTKPVNWELVKHRVRYTIRASIAFRGLANAQRIARLGNWEWYVDTGRVVCSDEAYRILGLARGAETPSCEQFLAAVLPRDRKRVLDARNAAVEALSSYEVSYRIHAPGQGTRFVHEQAEATLTGTPRTVRVVGTIQDITERRRFEEQITHMALHDALTGLPNRRMFKERLDVALARAEERGGRVGLLFFDLDQFKLINDTFGHDTGDEVLRAVAGRVSGSVRASSRAPLPAVPVDDDEAPLEVTVARLGGDEFMVLLPDLQRPEDAAAVARRLRTTLTAPFRVGEYELRLTPSMGITIFPDDGITVTTLLKNADVAMYHAKRVGRNNYQFFTAELSAGLQRRLAIENQLARALERGEMRLVYQPIYDLREERFAGAEALLRWTNESLGNVTPDEFISVAEETGHILPISEWVLRTACSECKKWIASGNGLRTVAVNLSAAQFRQRNFVDSVSRILDEVGLAPEHLDLELTESVLMDDIETSDRALRQLQELGLRMSIDDFGTGYSSLGYLRRFQPDNLKIDRSFIQGIDQDDDRANIVMAIMAMATALRIHVIAEGVETTGELEFLRRQRCHAVQGFLLARPVEANQIEDTVASAAEPAESDRRIVA